MNRAKGYRQYKGRGRGNGGKVFLVTVLILILLASLAYLLSRQYIVYDSDGSAHLELPFTLPFGKEEQPDTPAPNPIPDEEIHIEKEEEPDPEPEELPLYWACWRRGSCPTAA